MKIYLMPRVALMAGAVGLQIVVAHAQAPAGQPAMPPAAPLGPAQPITIAPEVRDVLQMLHDRKDTLKDFVGRIDYSVEDKTGDVTGKTGIVSFLMDPVKGAMFSADFDVNTKDGKPKMKYHTQFIFDGRELTIKDFGADNNVKQFVRTNMLPAGAKPGDAVTLNGALPLPIGMDVEEVAKNFEATLLPVKSVSQVRLKLVPRQGTKFDYESLVVNVDRTKDVELPISIVQTARGGDSVTTIVLKDLKINTGTAKMLDSNTPTSEGWTERGK